MKTRYIIWIITSIIIHLFCFYYVICFCSIYRNSSWSWFYGSLISFIMDIMVIELGSIILVGVIRHIAKTFPGKCSFITFRILNVIIEIVSA